MSERFIVVIDDMRKFVDPPEDTEVVYLEKQREAEEFLLTLERTIDELWLDNDLGLDGGEVYPIAVWMENLAHEGAPIDARRVIIHAANPGRQRMMRQALEGHYDVTVVDYPEDYGLVAEW